MEYCSAVRKNNFTAFAATWTGLEEIMLSEINQAEKELSYGFTHLWNIKKRKIGRRKKGIMKGVKQKVE